MVWISPKFKGVILLFVIQLRSTQTNEKYPQEVTHGPHIVDNKLKNRIDSAVQHWKPIRSQLINQTGSSIGDDKIYLTKVNVFESYKITNKSQVISKQSKTNVSKDQDVEETSTNVLRTLRLANPVSDYNGYDDDEGFLGMHDVYPRQKNLYRHSKRVRIIKPVHYLLPPKKNEQSRNMIKNDNSRQFYRIYKTQYIKSPETQLSEESIDSDRSTKLKDDMDAIRRNPRIKKVRRRPINYLRPPIITLTTTEHIFYIKPKETTPTSFIGEEPSSNEGGADNKTSVRSNKNVTRSLNSNNNLKPIKYSEIHSTTTEMNHFNRTASIDSTPDYNTLPDNSYTDTATVRIFNFSDNPVTVYSMRDIFGFGSLSKNEWKPQHNINIINDLGIRNSSITESNSVKVGEYEPIGSTLQSDTSFSEHGNTYQDVKELSWPITNNRNMESTTSSYIYSDEVLKSSSYIPDDVTYVTNDYQLHTTKGDIPTLPRIQPGISIQEINAMVANNDTYDSHKNPPEVSTYKERNFQSAQVTKNLISPEVQKAGMSVSKLGPMNNGNKINGENYWEQISRSHFNNQNSKPNKQNTAKGEYKQNYEFHLQGTTERSSGREVKLTVAESAHFRKSQSMGLKKDFLFQQNNVIPGEAGSDYPILSKPPLNSRFMCKADGKRYVADVTSGCQVFFMCVGDGPGEPMLCPNGTLFSQDFLVCDWWYNVDCRYP